MYSKAKKTKQGNIPANQQQSRAVANTVSQNKSDDNQDSGLVDNRPDTIVQRSMLNTTTSMAIKLEICV
ncbi:MAG: hypothetical protein H6Q17_414 [Bacteroidetes bacterium]|nr:hypothetical protein [Bacteroidota bacterium]